MSLASILGGLGLSVLDIADTAKHALAFVDLWDIAGGNASPSGRFFRFINAFVKNIPGSTRKEASAAYGFAKYWSNQGTVLSGMDPELVLDRRLAREITRTMDQWVEGQNYRTQVGVEITFGGSGETKTFWIYVFTKSAPQIAGVYAQAYESLMGQFRDTSRPASEGGTAPDWWVQFSIGEFARFEPE